MFLLIDTWMCISIPQRGLLRRCGPEGSQEAGILNDKERLQGQTEIQPLWLDLESSLEQQCYLFTFHYLIFV